MRLKLKLLTLTALASIPWFGVSAQTTPAYVSLQTEDLAKITYTWPITNTDENNRAEKREGKLTDVVYVSDDYSDPSVARAIALIRKVYMDPQVPGIWYRGYTADQTSGAGSVVNYGTGTQEGDVAYQGVGQISRTSSGGWNPTYSYNYVDSYGWNIPGTIEQIDYSNNRRFDLDQYKPTQQGYTLLLIEEKDSYSASTPYPTQGSDAYENLCRYFAQAIKSVRVVSQSVRTNEGTALAGTLFKLNVDDLNRFFFLSKGQARMFKNPNSWDLWGNVNGYYNYPYYYYSDNTYYDQEASSNNAIASSSMYPFYHMFEQFSPAEGTNGETLADVLMQMRRGETPSVIHDCISVLTAEGKGHGFKMTGETGEAETVHDLMFLIPDRRLTDWWTVSSDKGTGRGNNQNKNSRTQDFVQYNRNYVGYQPISGIYAIVLDGQASETNIPVPDDPLNGNFYQIDLTWNSNLYKFLPTHQQEFDLYRVTTDENGEYVYTPVMKWDPETKTYTDEPVKIRVNPTTEKIDYTYTDYVPSLSHGQEVTYAVQGIDVYNETFNFLTLQMSNHKSFFIPGNDAHELLELAIDANYWSTYDPVEQKNHYTNEIPMRNARGNSRVTRRFLSTSPVTVFHFKRKISATDDGVDFATATLESLTEPTNGSNGSCTFKISMADNQDNFTGAKANPSTVTCVIYRANETDKDGNIIHYANEVDFSNFKLYDNFSVTPDGGTEHRNEYVYMVSFTSAEPFVEGDEIKEVYSNMPVVPVFKTDLIINGNYTKEMIDADTNHALYAQPVDDNGKNVVKYNVQVTKDASEQKIREYRVHRWNVGNTPSIAQETRITEARNTGQAYTIDPAATADGEPKIDLSSSSSAWGKFINSAPGVGAYEFVPVVETYAPDDSHNTYGSVIKTTALGDIKVSVVEPSAEHPLMSEHTWEKGGKKYAYYSIYLNVDNIDLNNPESLVPDGYSLYKIRAWRQVDPGILGEQLATRQAVRVTDSGEYMYEELDQQELLSLYYLKNNVLGGRPVEPGTIFGVESGEWVSGNQSGTQEDAVRNEFRATFGAQKLRTEEGETGVIDKLHADFIVRMYFTRTANLPQVAGAPRRAVSTIEDPNFYIVEAKIPFDFDAKTQEVITGIISMPYNRQAQSVMYYNTMGLPSVTPWQGVNIVVTRYTDGTTSTTKVIK